MQQETVERESGGHLRPPPRRLLTGERRRRRWRGAVGASGVVAERWQRNAGRRAWQVGTALAVAEEAPQGRRRGDRNLEGVAEEMTQRALAQLLADDAQQHAAEREHHLRLRPLEQGAAPVWQAQQAAERDRSCDKTERRRLRRLAARQGPERKVTEKDSWASHLGEPALSRAAAAPAVAAAAPAAASGTLPTGLGARKQGDPARVKNVEGLFVVAPAAATRYVVVGRHQSDVEVIKEACAQGTAPNESAAGAVNKRCCEQATAGAVNKLAVNKLAFNSIPAGAGRRAALPASSGARWRFVMLAPKRARSCSSSAGASLARASSGEKFALPPPPA